MKSWFIHKLNSMAIVLLLFAGFQLANVPSAIGQKLPSVEEVNDQKSKFNTERGELVKSGAAKRFLPGLLLQAELFARRGDVALKSGRLLQAHHAFRQARWQLPYLGPEVPENVHRVFGSLRMRHSGGVLALAYSPDGKFLATASEDRTVKLWNMDNGHESKRLLGHGSEVRSIAFSPDGKLLASAGGDDYIRIWEVGGGKLLRTLKGKEGVSFYVNALTFSPDGKYIVSSWDDKSVRIYDVSDGSLKRTMSDFQQEVKHVAFSHDGKMMAAAAGDGQVRLWQYPNIIQNINQPEFWSVADRRGASYHIAFRPDGGQFARTYAEGIKIYTITPGAPIPTIRLERTIVRPIFGPGPSNPLTRFSCALFSNDGKTLFTGATDGLIRLYELSTGQLTGTFKGHSADITSLAFNPSGTELVSASHDHTVRRWPFNIVATSRELSAHSGPVWMADISPDGGRVVSASADKTVKVWELATGKVLFTLNGHTAPVTVARFSPEGKLIVSAGGDSLLKVWNAETGKHVRDLTGHGGTVTALDFSADGKKIVSGSVDRSIRVWDAAAGKELLNIETNTIVAAVAFHPNGKQIASGQIDQAIHLWDAAGGKRVNKWFAHAESVSALAFSKDGKMLASCGADQLVKVWDLASPGQHPITFAGHDKPLSFVAFRPDGKYVISAGGDNVIKLWKLADGSTKEPVQDYRGHTDWVSTVAFSKDGHFFVSASVDKTIRLWEITSRELPLLAEHTGAVKAVAVSADGKYLASGGTDQTVKIWDLKTGAEFRTLRGHKGDIVSIAFSPDAKTLFTAAMNGMKCDIYRWDLATGNKLADKAGHQQHFLNFPKAVPLLQVSPGGKNLFVWAPVSERSTIIKTLEIESGNRLRDGADAGRHVTSVGLAPNGTKAALGGAHGSVRIYDMDQWNVLPGGDWFLFGNNEKVTSLCINIDGKTLIAANDKGVIKIGDIKTAKVLKTINGHSQKINRCVISPDGKRFATAGQDNVVKLWDIDTGKMLREWTIRSPIQIYTAFVADLAFTSGGKQLISANSNSTIYVLDLP